MHHLLSALKSNYTISEDWTAQLYIAITLQWDYVHCTVDLYMPNYVKPALYVSNTPILEDGKHHTNMCHLHMSLISNFITISHISSKAGTEGRTLGW